MVEALSNISLSGAIVVAFVALVWGIVKLQPTWLELIKQKYKHKPDK